MLNRIARSSLVVLVAMVILGAGSSAFAADKPLSFGIQGNWSDDADFGVGGRLIVDMGKQVENLEIVGSFDIFFPGDEVDYLEVNANAIYKIKLDDEALTPYLGAGLNVARASVFDVSDTEVGLNVLGGVLFSKKFFAEARFEAGGGETFVVSAGIRF